MKGNFVFSTMILITLLSCAVEVSEENITVSSTTGEENLGPYPNTESNDAIDKKNENPWRCGHELITVKGPQGELITIDVLLACNPLSDKYFGDPAPFLENKKN